MQATLVGDGADDGTGTDFVPLSHGDAIGGQVIARLAGGALAIRPLGTLPALLRRRLGHQEFRTVAGLNRQRGGDIGHRHVVVALVLLDESAEDVESRTADRVGDGVAEFLDPLGVDVLYRGQIHLGDGLAGHLLDGLEQMAFPRRDEQQRGARASGPAGAPDPVDIGLRVVRNVVVHHVRDALDVEAPGSDVGGHQDVDGPVLQCGDRALPDRLRDVAVDRGRGEPTGTQLFGDLLGGLFGANEHDHRLERLDLEHPGQGVHLARAGYLDITLSDVLGGRGLGLDGHFDGVVQIFAGDAADRRRHGGGEERDLFVLRGVGEDTFDILGETHLQHLVGLVKHQVVQVGQVQRAALEVVDDPARSAHHDLGPTPQARQLHGVGLAAVDRQYRDLGQMGAVAAECFRDLQSKLPGRRQHQRLGVLAGDVDAGENRDREGRRLTGAGLSQPDDVGARHQRRNGGRLDG